MSQPIDRTVTLTLGYDEAVVVFEWAHRHEDENYSGRFFSNDAERVAIANLTASLEPEVDEVFGPNYGEVVEAAAKRLVADL